MRHNVAPVTMYSVAEAAALLGVSDDTVRGWVEGGRLPGESCRGRLSIEGADLAAFAASQAATPAPGTITPASARNRLRGVVTRVRRDGVMAQVDLQCGPFRLVSLMTREAADELGLEPGVLAVASVKATSVVVELPTR